MPILSRTELQGGVEYLFVEQFRDELESDRLRSDRNELVSALQVANNSDYLGYNLWTLVGLRTSRIDRRSAVRVRKETSVFVTVYAGFE